MIDSKTYDTLKIVAIALGCIAGALTGVGELLNNTYVSTAGAILMIADSALLKFLAESSKQYFEDKDIVQKAKE